MINVADRRSSQPSACASAALCDCLAILPARIAGHSWPEERSMLSHGENRPRSFVLASLCICLLAFAGGGCTALRAFVARNSTGEINTSNGVHTITPAELDELTRAADRYVGLLSSTCDALKGNRSGPASQPRNCCSTAPPTCTTLPATRTPSPACSTSS